MKKTMSILILGLLSFGAFAKGEFETNTILDVKNEAIKLAGKYGAKKVLLVFDIDNTLITMPQNLGSDQWFGWQYANCIGKKEVKDFCVSSSMNDLLGIQSQLFALSNSLPSEPMTAKVIKELQKKGFKILLLTSRGPGMRAQTERSLKQNDLIFDKTTIGPKLGFAGPYFPYQLNSLTYFGLTKKDMKTAKLRKPRPVSFNNGIYMTAGQNKGAMLKAILYKTRSKFKAVVFVDDHIKHTKRMQAIMASRLDLTTYRYGAIDKNVKAFKDSDKSTVISGWKILRDASRKVFR